MKKNKTEGVPCEYPPNTPLSGVDEDSLENLELLKDVELQVTAELGRSKLPIGEVLKLARGSIIELQKQAGKPVDLYVQGKLIAKGEVLVIEDNFGVRVTKIMGEEE